MRARILYILFTILFFIPLTLQGQKKYPGFSGLNTATGRYERLPDNIMPVLGSWFWGEDEFMPEGYKIFIDHVKTHAPYNILTTSVRVHAKEATYIDVHDQVKKAVEYANLQGIKIALDLDVRLARRTFQARYPGEQQELLWLDELKLTDKPVKSVVRSIDLTDHMTGSTTHYIPLSGKLVRVYSYDLVEGTVDPGTLKDITAECSVISASRDSVVVLVPPAGEVKHSSACVMVSFTHLTPDVFAPHLLEFQREILMGYADVPLIGAMKDEWGFPPTRDPVDLQYWYSEHLCRAYSERTGGRDLIADILLMYKGIRGHEKERYMAVNILMEMNLLRNGEIEDHFYRTVKEVFGPLAIVVTHPTWYSSRFGREYKKNGLDWWIAKRDWAQTDEDPPFAARTSLAKKWGSPFCYNQYYSPERKGYHHELWSSVLLGSRINYHPLYVSRKPRLEKHINLFRSDLMRGESRVRLLNYIWEKPVDCPVAVVFGHPCTMNWAGPAYDDTGTELVNKLWCKGIKTDLIPSSEIRNGSLKIDEDGWIIYGQQRYFAVVLYHPEFETVQLADFFTRASQGKTKLFRNGDWKTDFNGNPFPGNEALPKSMFVSSDNDLIVDEITRILKKQKVMFQTPSLPRRENDYSLIMHPSTGTCRLIDGTVIFVSGADSPGGDPIKTTMPVKGFNVSFDAIGVAAVNLNNKGEVQKLAAGGLKSFSAGKFKIELQDRLDIVLWRNDSGRWEGVIQGLNGEIPRQLMTITSDWKLLDLPESLPEED